MVRARVISFAFMVASVVGAGCTAGGGGGSGRDAAVAPMDGSMPDTAVAECVDGEQRCTGNDWEICGDGVFEVMQRCAEACEPTLGCYEVDECSVSGLDAPIPCTEEAPADSFDPVVQWEWQKPEVQSGMPALVANLTDDNGDGVIDLCDVPDVLVTTVVPTSVPGAVADTYIHVLNGETGVEHLAFTRSVAQITPAVGDVDGDGLPEIVTVTESPSYEGRGNLIAFEHDGSVAFEGDPASFFSEVGAVTLADLDADGDTEILVHNRVFDHEGNFLWEGSEAVGFRNGAIAADLDGDEDLEVIFGRTAFHHDGTSYYDSAAVPPEGFTSAQVADLDGDGGPEVVVTHRQGITVLDATGAMVDEVVTGEQHSPATIHDFDGDGMPEITVTGGGQLAMYEHDLSLAWSIPAGSGFSSPATGFDFLGDGTAEVAYVDGDIGGIYDSTGERLMSLGSSSYVSGSFPTVADIDNDGSAEVVVSWLVGTTLHVVAMRDREDRWVPSRRIWNQYSYHVTNVREDATIPQVQTPSHRDLNTFRTNAQVEGGRLCEPPLI